MKASGIYTTSLWSQGGRNVIYSGPDPEEKKKRVFFRRFQHVYEHRPCTYQDNAIHKVIKLVVELACRLTDPAFTKNAVGIIDQNAVKAINQNEKSNQFQLYPTKYTY